MTATLPTAAGKPVPPTMTAEQFLAFDWPANERWELLDGVPTLLAMNPPLGKHQRTITSIQRAMFAIDPDEQHGEWIPSPFGLALPRDTFVEPDLGLFEHGSFNDDLSYQLALPLIVVDVLSSDERADREVKFLLCMEAGIREYWVVDPVEPGLQVFALADTGRYRQVTPRDGLVESPVLGLRLRLAREPQRYVFLTQPA